ncbi:MAG TPA: histidine kinase dimerization/phospho-acceptor domain-containing protein, partial [Candidatus Binatia bacterium]
MPYGRTPRKGWLAVVVVVALVGVTGALVSSLQWVNRPFPGFFIYGNLTVAPYFLPRWSGKTEGLKFLDRVLSVQGEPLSDSKMIYDLVRAAPAGTEFQYTVEKDGQIVQLSIHSMKFSFNDWLLSFGTYLVAGLGFLVIGFMPFYMRATSPGAAPLFFMVSAVFVWFTTTFDFMTLRYLPTELRVFALTFTPSAALHLALALSGGYQELKRSRRYLYLIYGISIVLALVYTLTFYGPMAVWRWGLRLDYGYTFLASLAFLGLLWTGLRNPISDLERSRLRIILFGALLGFVFPTLGTVLTSFFSWEVPYNVSLIPTVFFPLSVAYALLKYSLFDLDFVVKAGLARGALAGVLLLLYVLLVSFLGVGAGIYGQEPLVPLFFSALVVLIFNPLLRSIEGAVDHYVYRKEYDPAQLQAEVSVLLRSLSRPQAISEKCVKLVADRMKLDSACLWFGPDNTAAATVASVGVAGDSVREMLGRLHVLWTRHFGLSRKGLSRGEWSAEPLDQDRRDEFGTIFDGARSELAIPIVFQEQIVGFISLGKRQSGRGYDGDDFRLVCALADQLALALENGRLFEDSERAKESYRDLYDEAEALNRRLIEADRQKKDFVANISHELRTPVCTILGYAEVLRDPAFVGDRRAILDRVANHGHELSQLMDNLLQFCRMESGSLAVAFREMNIAEVFQSIEIMAGRLIKERPIQFRMEIDPVVERILTDPEKFQQVLMHFLTNAIKFTERGEITAGIRRMPETRNSFVECWIADTGIGIS